MRFNIKRPRWYRDGIRPWLDKGEIPADPIGDFRTSDNAVSVFLIQDDESNLERVLAALAAPIHCQERDYLLFDTSILENTGITIRESLGQTKDKTVNTFHRDLINLSGRKLLALITQILNSDYKTERLIHNQVLNLVIQAVESGQLNRADVHSSLIERFPKPETNA